MKKRGLKNTLINIEKKIKIGKGNGIGANYMPWIETCDIPSLGRVTRVKGWKSGRVNHLLSDLERNYFYMLEWSDKVVDIREQFPMDFSETLEIARSLGIRHPKDPQTKEYVVMTTDFVITFMEEGREIIRARTAKYLCDLMKKRVQEKLEIEKAYWDRHGINWGIVTEDTIKKAPVDNIQWVYKAKSLENYNILSDINLVEAHLLELIKDNKDNIAVIANLVDKLLHLEKGTALLLVRYLIANKIWKVDMEINIIEAKDFNLLNFTDRYNMIMRDEKC